MNIGKEIYAALEQASLEEVLDIKDLNNLDWFWINRDIFDDILKTIKDIDYYDKQNEIKDFLHGMPDQDFIKPLREEIKERGFIESTQDFFAKIEDDYRLLGDIETWIFIKESYYNKLWIKKFNELEWVLKAMAIDVYQRLDFSYSSLSETYKELFEGNSRIIEEVLIKEVYVLESGKWILDEKTGSLIFYKNNKIFNEWGKGEVEFKFDDLRLY